MKDTTIKNNGKAFNIKAPEDMPETFEEWREQAIAGNAFLDVSLNTSTGPDAGCDVVGTPQNKATLLSDTTKAALELKQADPTVDDALYALSQKTQPAVLNVHTNSGVVVTCTKGSKVLSATANGSGLAVLYPDEFGTWTLKATVSGKALSLPFEIDAIRVYDTTLTTVLEDASWDLISAVAKAGNAASVWKVGDKKTINVNGVPYVAQIIGFNHDDVVDSAGYGRAKAGITWQLVDCLATTYQMNGSNTNVGGWTSSVMRTSTMGTLFSQLDDDLKNVIALVKKITSSGNQLTSLDTTEDKLFLLSEIEIFGKTTYSKAGEGTQYAWYGAGNPTIKNRGTSANSWWERSPYGSIATTFCNVYSSGNANYGGASGSFGVAFGFCV